MVATSLMDEVACHGRMSQHRKTDDQRPRSRHEGTQRRYDRRALGAKTTMFSEGPSAGRRSGSDVRAGAAADRSAVSVASKRISSSLFFKGSQVGTLLSEDPRHPVRHQPESDGARLRGSLRPGDGAGELAQMSNVPHVRKR